MTVKQARRKCHDRQSGDRSRRRRTVGVFISYASADDAYAKLLAKDLSLRGIAPWYDQWDSTVGAPVASMLQDAIRSHPWFLVLFTKNTLKSTWVIREIKVARTLQQKHGTPAIIPCLFEDTELPQWVREISFADFRKDHRAGFAQILARITGADVNEYHAFQRLDEDRGSAGVLFRRGEYSESKELYLGCLKQLEIVRAHVYLNLGLIAFNQYEFEDSIRHFKYAYRTFRREGDLRRETDALQYLAHYYALLGNFRQAQLYLRRLLDRTRGRAIHTWNVMRQGMLDIERGRFTSAWKTLAKALQAFQRQGNDFGVSATKYLMARIRLCERRSDEAIVLLGEAIPYSREANDPKGVSYTLLRLGQCYLMKNEYRRAVEYFSELSDVLKNDPDANATLEAEGLLVACDRGNVPRATVRAFKRVTRGIQQEAKKFPAVRKLRETLGVGANSVLIEGV